jgi:hydroxypyruvate reductase 1
MLSLVARHVKRSSLMSQTVRAFSSSSIEGIPVEVRENGERERERERHSYPLSSAERRTCSLTATHATLQTLNPEGKHRVLVTKDLPGTRWRDILTSAGCRVDICKSPDTILDNATIKTLIGTKCDGVVGQLTEDWGAELFEALKQAGGRAYSNYAVGYNNVVVPEATARGIAVGNTPGVLTETTAELAASLTFAAARRVVEADVFMRAEKYKGWLPDLFVGSLLQNKTVGIIGAGRIGTAYARMMIEGHKMNLAYYDPYPNKFLEDYVKDYSKLVESRGEAPITVTRCETVEDVLKTSDVVSLHCNLDENTKHLINKQRLEMMKPDAVLVNAARGPVIDETALVSHLQKNPEFRVGLDVFEDEPLMKKGLKECANAVIVPHIASATLWTRSGMATLASKNVAAILSGHKPWTEQDVLAFVDGPFDDIPSAAPSIVNAKDLSL